MVKEVESIRGSQIKLKFTNYFYQLKGIIYLADE
jgi:hypothetical protein